MQFVCVLDMDETLGTFLGNVFHIRPFTDTLIQLLRLLNFEIILWSLGSDQYVQRVVNGHLPGIKKYASKIFARKECDVSIKRYNNIPKASDHIRVMYDKDVFLIGIDDKVGENMDSRYDLRIYVIPYKKPNVKDRALLDVINTIIIEVSKMKETRGLLPCYDIDNRDENEEVCENSWIC